MRKISILNEDYLHLQEACGKANRHSETQKAKKKEKISDAVKYLKENAENEGAIYEFIYNEAVEELLNMDITEGFAEIARKIKNSEYLSLDESIELAHSINKELDADSKDDCESIKNLFSDKGVDIPECKGEECFRVTPNAMGKMEAIKKLQNLTLKAENIQDQTKKCIKNADNANALDYLKLEENLSYLADIKVLFEDVYDKAADSYTNFYKTPEGKKYYNLYHPQDKAKVKALRDGKKEALKVDAVSNDPEKSLAAQEKLEKNFGGTTENSLRRVFNKTYPNEEPLPKKEKK